MIIQFKELGINLKKCYKIVVNDAFLCYILVEHEKVFLFYKNLEVKFMGKTKSSKAKKSFLKEVKAETHGKNYFNYAQKHTQQNR